ncbi:hypothetical protein [cf. Phormidesmis sp. LEGE 11477]|uniref:hypothetical protein n=1 Tax=cf. Phormidesmis sp. LEGE 11477 TaxID=1828680 RepID=UPI00187E8313|nr:hypothetical protein [cf. Phormidesmis sp. LEGE 11477]MBE9062228.1 hypothetical protein [cf. Phormidesmis sp. LEGE 11477]
MVRVNSHNEAITPVEERHKRSNGVADYRDESVKLRMSLLAFGTTITAKLEPFVNAIAYIRRIAAMCQ